jgi:thiol-disulfide isomerase/thioredoxin
MKRNRLPARVLSLIACWLMMPLPAVAAELELKSGAQISVEQFGGGPNRLLWLPSVYGFNGAVERELAARMATQGLEVWLADLHGSYFLPPGPSSLNGVAREDIRDLITLAQPPKGRLYLFSYGRGAALTLEAARLWQLSADKGARPLGGVLLLHPNLMAGTARAGEAPEFLPIAGATNLPLFLLQPMNSAKRWYLEALMERLQQGGSDLFYRPLSGVSDGFQVRDDATEYEREVRGRLPQMLHTALQLLSGYNRERRQAVVALPATTVEKAGEHRFGLQPIAGKPAAAVLQLSDLDGKGWELAALRGEVVLINFWATWCPPCVEEIPSLGRLNKKLAGRPFRVISVDVGEEAQQVRDFLKRVPADYPVLLDPEGSSTGPWKIRAFPTSFLIDRQGRLRYGYFGGLQWDAPEVVARIEALLQE